MDIPFFSIITCTYKRPGLLQRAIRSVQQQSFTDYEHIIVDDGNDHDTQLLIRELNDPKVKFFTHSVRKGGAGTLNTGIREAKGKYVSILDDDDEFLPDFLLKSWHAIHGSNEETGFLWTGILCVTDGADGETVVRRESWPARFSNPEAGLLVATAIGNGFGLSIRRGCFETIGYYDENLVAGFDTDLLLRLAEKFTFRTVPEILVKIHRDMGARRTSAEKLRIRATCYNQIILKNLKFLSKHWGILYIHTVAYVNLCHQSGQSLTAGKALFRLLLNHPGRLIVYADIFAFVLYGRDVRSLFPDHWLTLYLIRQTGINYE